MFGMANGCGNGSVSGDGPGDGPGDGSGPGPLSGEWLTPEGAQELTGALVETAGRIAAATSAYLGLLARFDAAQGYFTPECRSAAHWLNWRCGESLASAREQIRVARALGALPLISGAFARGEFSYTQVRSLVRVATAETEGCLVEVARYCTGSQLGRLMRGYRQVLESQASARANELHAQRRLHYFFDEEGFFVIKGRLSAEEGRVVQAALEQALHELAVAPPVAGGSAEVAPGEAADPWGANRADALVALAEGSLAHGLAGRAAPERTQVIVHVSAETLAGAGLGEHCELQDGPPLAPESARRLACDASLIALVEDASGNPLSVGRRTRKISPSLRRALASRDGGCVFPGCGQTRFVQGHHIRHWAAGGETSLANLASLCSLHHRLMHEGGYRLVVQEGGFSFVRPDGRVVNPRPPRRGPHDGHLEVVVDPAHTLSRSEGNRMDTNYVLGCLFQHDSRIRPAKDFVMRPDPPRKGRSREEIEAQAEEAEEDEEWLPVISDPLPEPEPDPASMWWLLHPPAPEPQEPGPGAGPEPAQEPGPEPAQEPGPEPAPGALPDGVRGEPAVGPPPPAH
ncbi:MAG: hypothetical protein NVSMB32_01180 [Actinomycetota bacterium]